MAKKPKKAKPEKEPEIKIDVVDKVYDMDKQEACTRCKTSFENFSGQRIGVGMGQTPGGEKGWKEVICPACDFDERMDVYKQKGEMSSRLVTDAVMARIHIVEYNDLDRIRATTAAQWRKHKDTLLEIADKNDKITKRGREFEEKHWIGDKGLQGYYKKSPARGHSAETETYKALLWGSAGRVMLTLQDRYPQGNPKSKFGGAWISLIFDEDSKECRGGIQGYCATFEEAMGLLNAAYDAFPQLEADEDVRMAGM